MTETKINKGAQKDRITSMYRDLLEKEEEEKKMAEAATETKTTKKTSSKSKTTSPKAVTSTPFSSTLVIGMGQCGANVADVANTAGFSTCVVNTSEEDVKNCSVKEKFIYKNAKGSGKERTRSKSIFAENIDEFIKFLNDKFSSIDTYIIVCSAGGGTGGGSGPMCANFLKENFPNKNIFLVVVQGSIAEDIKSQENMAEVFEELTKAEVNYLVYDNDRAGDYDNIDEMYSQINNEIVESCKFISRGYFEDNSRSNIDEMDMQKLYLDNKRMFIVSGNFDKRMSNNESYTDQMIKAIENSTQAPPTGNPMSYAFFMSVDQNIYNEIDTNFRDIIDRYGESYETYRHLQDNNDNAPDFAICMTGLPDCVERYELINRRIKDYKARVEYTRNLSDVERVAINARANQNIALPRENETKKKSAGIDKSSLSKFM